MGVVVPLEEPLEEASADRSNAAVEALALFIGSARMSRRTESECHVRAGGVTARAWPV